MYEEQGQPKAGRQQTSAGERERERAIDRAGKWSARQRERESRAKFSSYFRSFFSLDVKSTHAQSAGERTKMERNAGCIIAERAILSELEFIGEGAAVEATAAAAAQLLSDATAAAAALSLSPLCFCTQNSLGEYCVTNSSLLPKKKSNC